MNQNLPVLMIKKLIILPYQEVRIELNIELSKKIVDLSDIMEYMFPCTSFSESMYYNGASSDGGYIKIYEIS